MNNGSQIKDYDYMFKLVLLGSSGVGKSNILLRFTRDEFQENAATTIGVQYATKTIQTANNKKIKFQIWDTAGQEQYRALMKTFYKGASAAILTYDITHEKSFTDLQYWHKQIKQYCKSEIVVMLVGNKSDLDESRKVSKQDGLSFAEKNRVAFYQVSAKSGTNIELIFSKIAEELQKIMEQSDKNKSITATKSVQQTIVKEQATHSSSNNNKQQNVNLSKKTAVDNQTKKKKSCC